MMRRNGHPGRGAFPHDAGGPVQELRIARESREPQPIVGLVPERLCDTSRIRLLGSPPSIWMKM